MSARILLVDDDPKITNLVAAILRKEGNYEVRQENRSYLAFDTAKTFQPDLVVLDVDMPGKDGNAVAAQLSEDPALATIPILFLTSMVSRHGEGEQQLVCPGIHFIPKPPDPAELRYSVASLLALSGTFGAN